MGINPLENINYVVGRCSTTFDPLLHVVDLLVLFRILLIDSIISSIIHTGYTIFKFVFLFIGTTHPLRLGVRAVTIVREVVNLVDLVRVGHLGL